MKELILTPKELDNFKSQPVVMKCAKTAKELARFKSISAAVRKIGKQIHFVGVNKQSTIVNLKDKRVIFEKI